MEIAGLPAHILLIHGVVVLAPLAGVLGVVFALVRRARRYLAWPLGVLALLMVPLSVLTAEAGEQLEKARPFSQLIQEHAEQGSFLRFVTVFFLAVVAAQARSSLPVNPQPPARLTRPGRTPGVPLAAAGHVGAGRPGWRVPGVPKHCDRPLRGSFSLGRRPVAGVRRRSGGFRATARRAQTSSHQHPPRVGWGTQLLVPGPVAGSYSRASGACRRDHRWVKNC
ncbi:hypothetical protein NG819_07385 [Pseudarthrobacter sp. Fe7]|nr:hypothetical protein NG819_07385 [Pseudarthrobacter sp. Fe7]